MCKEFVCLLFSIVLLFLTGCASSNISHNIPSTGPADTVLSYAEGQDEFNSVMVARENAINQTDELFRLEEIPMLHLDKN